MPFWKAKKKEELTRQKLCPNCLKATLRHSSQASGLIVHEQYYCSSCGYVGVVYVDVDPNDKNEDDLELELIQEEGSEILKQSKPIEELAALALKEKWLPDQKNNHLSLRTWCPFCADVSTLCTICKCPHDICAKHATEGFIGELNKKHDDETELCNVDPVLYQKIVVGFQNLAKLI